MDIATNKSFCVLPWVNITTDPDGSIKPCCTSSDFIKKSDGKHYNLGHDSISDICNSQEFVDLRTKMLAGEMIPGCSQCYAQEKYGGQSQRITYFDTWKESNTFLEKVKQGPIVTPAVEYFDLRFGNLCNLSCRSCSPRGSSQLVKEVAKSTILQKFHPDASFGKLNEWYTTSTFKQNIQNELTNIKRLYLTGGEPTIIEENYLLLKQLTQMGLAKDIGVVLSTNMTNLKDEWISALKDFKRVTFYISIDGVGLMQEYLRYPSKWSQIDKNITALAHVNLPNFYISPTPVIQIMNLGYMTELFEYFEQFNRTAGKTVFNIMPIILENPPRLDCLNLPTEYKQKCFSKIEEWVASKCTFQGHIFHNKISHLKNKCNTAAEFTEHLASFFEFNDAFDALRNTPLKDVNPEVNSLR